MPDMFDVYIYIYIYLTFECSVSFLIFEVLHFLCLGMFECWLFGFVFKCVESPRANTLC